MVPGGVTNWNGPDVGRVRDAAMGRSSAGSRYAMAPGPRSGSAKGRAMQVLIERHDGYNHPTPD